MFAVNVGNRWSNAAVSEYDIPIDVNNDGTADYTVVAVDQGAVQTGTFNGVMGAFVFSERSGGAAIDFLATAPHDSSTILIPVLSSSALPGGRAVPERGQPAARLLGGRIRPDRHGRPGSGRRHREVQRVVELDQPGWLPDGGARRHRDGDDHEERR